MKISSQYIMLVGKADQMLGIVREGMEIREHGEASAKICAITSILNVVDASDFLSQKDYCRTGEGQKTAKGIGWFLYKERLSWLGFFWMEEERLRRETAGIYKTIGSEDNSDWKRPYEVRPGYKQGHGWL